jgi:hypothetical protein
VTHEAHLYRIDTKCLTTANYNSQKGLKKNCCNVEEKKERRGKHDERTGKLKGYKRKWRKKGGKKYSLSPVIFAG